jgi:hypothetical protein
MGGFFALILLKEIFKSPPFFPEWGKMTLSSIAPAILPSFRHCLTRVNVLYLNRQMNGEKFWEELWNSLLLRMQVPVKGILLDPKLAEELGEPILMRLIRGCDGLDEVAVTADALEEGALLSKNHIATDRVKTGDQEQHRDPSDDRYDRNLNLPDLKETDKTGKFTHREWALLDQLLRPLGFRVLHNKGLRDEDGEEVFNETLAIMAHRKQDRPAPIEELIVFEEIIPNFCRRLGFRAIDHIRRHTSQKARPEHLESLDSMVTEEGNPIDIPDHSASDSDHPDSWRFEEIYSRCQELLTATEWNLIFDLYVAQKYTVKDLIADPDKLATLGIANDRAASTLRTRVEAIINPALEKLALELSV